MHPKHVQKIPRTQKFDVILANPPFSLRNWGMIFGTQRRRPLWTQSGIHQEYGDYALFNTCLFFKVQRKIGVVVPMGVLFRGGKEKPIRQNLIDQDLIYAVVGLGPIVLWCEYPCGIDLFKEGQRSKMKTKFLLSMPQNRSRGNRTKFFDPKSHRKNRWCCKYLF